MVENINKEYPLMDFTLKYNKERSFFKQEKNIPHDPLQYKLASILINSNFDWFQNVKNSEVIINDEIKEQSYQVVYKKMNISEWILSEKTKVIDSYTCYKAERKELNNRTRNHISIIAWYAPEIPIPYGPIGEGGLPGVILQLKKNFFIYEAKKYF